MVTLVTKFPSIDQFRFPGWFNFAFSGLILLLMLLFFKDVRIKKDSDSDPDSDPDEKKKFSFKKPNITTILVSIQLILMMIIHTLLQ